MRYFFDAMNETMIVSDTQGQEIEDGGEMPEAILEAVEGIARLLGENTSLDGWHFVIREGQEAPVATIRFEDIGDFVAPGGGIDALRPAA